MLGRDDWQDLPRSESLILGSKGENPHLVQSTHARMSCTAPGAMVPVAPSFGAKYPRRNDLHSSGAMVLVDSWAHLEQDSNMSWLQLGASAAPVEGQVPP